MWAFGVLLWEMYSGVRPWAGMAGITIIHNLTIKKRTLELPANSTPAFKVGCGACSCPAGCYSGLHLYLLAKRDPLLRMLYNLPQWVAVPCLPLACFVGCWHLHLWLQHLPFPGWVLVCLNANCICGGFEG